MANQQEDPQEPAVQEEEDPCPGRPGSPNWAQQLASEYSSTIEVLVGEKGQRFLVYEKPLIAASGYFRAALEGHGTWLETNERSFRLPDVNPGIFSMFVHWIYTNDTDVINKGAPEDLEEYLKFCMAKTGLKYPKPKLAPAYMKYWAAKAQSTDWRRLIAGWILGDRLQSPDFKNALIDHAIDWFTYAEDTMEMAPMCEAARYAYENTTPNSTLRKMILDVLFWGCGLELVKANLCSAQHQDLVLDLANHMADYERFNFNRRGDGADERIAPFEVSREAECAAYHDHAMPTGVRKRRHSAVES